MRLDVERILENVSGHYSRSYQDAIEKLILAQALQDRTATLRARERLELVTTETMGIGEVIGATIALRDAATQRAAEEMAMRARRSTLLLFADAPTQSIVPRITFQEAVEDMVERTPVTLRRAADRTAQRIAQLYSQGHVVAFAKSAEAAVTERVQALIAESIREGVPEAQTGRLIKLGVQEIAKRTGAWAESYARMAFRTNLNTAVTAGRFRQAQDPDIKSVVPAFVYDAVNDSDTRPNHAAADGMVMRVDNPAWRKIAPPLGYNCRCQVRFIGLPELRRMGRVTSRGEVREDRIPAGAYPDEGFRHGGRPDLMISAGGQSI